MSAGSDHITIRTYGRRKGHSLSPRKLRLVDTLLPGLRLDLSAPAPSPLTSIFSSPVSRVWLEIGFGGGEHLAAQAESNPDIGVIGCEPFINGVAKLLCEIDARNLTNIRIWDDDARDVLDWLEDGSVERVFVLFPDPWPKKRHQKRRLISPGTLETLARVMKPGAELRRSEGLPPKPIASAWPIEAPLPEKRGPGAVLCRNALPPALRWPPRRRKLVLESSLPDARSAVPVRSAARATSTIREPLSAGKSM